MKTNGLRRWVRCIPGGAQLLVCLVLATALSANSQAQSQTPEAKENPSLETRLDVLEKENQALRATLDTLQPTAPADAASVRSLVSEFFKEEQAKRDAQQGVKGAQGDPPKAAAAPADYVVGSDPRLNAVWNNSLNFQSEQKDWNIHIGGRFQFQPTFWQQPRELKGPPPGAGGIPNSAAGDGVGALDDGLFFRRVRLRTDGTGYELVEFTMEVDFEQLNLITFDHLWVGVKEVPLLGTVRVGQHKVPMGLEQVGSDYHLTFLERSSLSDGFWTLFAPGIFVGNTYLEDHVTFQTMFHRIQPLGFF